MRLFRYLFEDSSIVNKAEDLAELLKKAYKVSYKTIKDAWKKSGESYPEFYELLSDIKKEAESKPQEIPPDEGIKDLGHGELDHGSAAPEASDKLRDESVVDVLSYLSNYWKNKDKVRVVAARLGIDPDLYELAGLGKIPSDPSDEDVWKTMDMSKKGKLPFYQSAWQPFYIDAMQDLKSLPDEVKDEIQTIVQSGSEAKSDVEYPIDDKNVGRTFESKLLDDIILESDGFINIIPKGTKIRID